MIYRKTVKLIPIHYLATILDGTGDSICNYYSLHGPRSRHIISRNFVLLSGSPPHNRYGRPRLLELTKSFSVAISA